MAGDLRGFLLSGVWRFGRGFTGSVAGTSVMHPALRALLSETVTHYRYLEQDGYGRPAYSSATFLPARVEYRVRRIVTAQGEERVSRARIFLDGNVSLILRDKVVLPDGTAPALQLLTSVRDEWGAVHHHELFI